MFLFAQKCLSSGLENVRGSNSTVLRKSQASAPSPVSLSASPTLSAEDAVQAMMMMADAMDVDEAMDSGAEY